MPTSVTGKSDPCSGLTLLEVIVVLALIGLLGAIALPRLDQRVSSGEVQAAAEDLRGLMTLARARAIGTATTVRLEVDQNARSFAVPEIDRRLVLKPSIHAKVTSGVSPGQAPGAALFSPNGSSSGAEIVLWHETNPSDVWIVRVDWLLGLASIERPGSK